MKRLCLVEDDEIMGESLAVRFRLEGFDVRWHRDAESADQALSGDAACAVVCDIRLPGISGDRWFESLHGRCAVLPPFIFITGHGDLERAVELLKLGAADYVTKPFDIDRLLLRVRELAGDVALPPGEAPVLGVSRGHAAAGATDCASRPARFDRADYRRNGHRQGSRGAPPACPERSQAFRRG